MDATHLVDAEELPDGSIRMGAIFKPETLQTQAGKKLGSTRPFIYGMLLLTDIVLLLLLKGVFQTTMKNVKQNEGIVGSDDRGTVEVPMS